MCNRLYAGDMWYEVHEFSKYIAVNFNLNVFLTLIYTMLIYSDTFGICHYFHSCDDIGELLLSKILRSTKSSFHCNLKWNGCWHRIPVKLINLRSIQNIFHFGFEVFTLVLVKIQVFWDLTPYASRLVYSYWYFRGTCSSFFKSVYQWDQLGLLFVEKC